MVQCVVYLAVQKEEKLGDCQRIGKLSVCFNNTQKHQTLAGNLELYWLAYT